MLEPKVIYACIELHWKMRVITIYEEEREIIVTYVSTTSGLQKQPNKAEKGQMNSQTIETSY